MRVLLRDKGSGCFYKCPEAWTACSSEAFDFRCSAAAIELVAYTRSLRERDLEILLCFDDPHYNVALPARVRRGP